VSIAVIVRFLAGTREDLRLSTASKLCASLGLRLVDPSAGRRSKG